MKYFILFNFLLLIKIILASKIPNLSNENKRVKIKRRESSDECKYINSLLNKNDSYNCCNVFTCEEGHITEIVLSSYNFNGRSIPESIGNLIELRKLNRNIIQTQLNGIIPESIGNLTKLNE
eukprot:jgi/Orpsp1_1/1191620/evm.model.d7180000087387.1